MRFKLIEPFLEPIAEHAFEFCTSRYGSKGVQIEASIDGDLGWRPTFSIRLNRFEVLAVEVSATLDPQILQIASHNIGVENLPISILLAYPSELFTGRGGPAIIRKSIDRGYGVLAIDLSAPSSPACLLQAPFLPVVQHIPESAFTPKCKVLPKRWQSTVRRTFDTYRQSPRQGLQELAQSVEEVVRDISRRAKKKYGTAYSHKENLADILDRLYGTSDFFPQRAALGGARDFVKRFRNAASHPPKSKREASEQFALVREGFFVGLAILNGLLSVGAAHGWSISPGR